MGDDNRITKSIDFILLFVTDFCSIIEFHLSCWYDDDRGMRYFLCLLFTLTTKCTICVHNVRALLNVDMHYAYNLKIVLTISEWYDDCWNVMILNGLKLKPNPIECALWINLNVNTRFDFVHLSSFHFRKCKRLYNCRRNG